MNTKTKKRLVIVTGIIIMLLIVVLAVVGGASTAKTITVAQAASGEVSNQRVQVTGNVLQDSYTMDGNTLTFTIYDPNDTSSPTLKVIYDGAAATTFGNDVTAICTGKVLEDGILHASELVTKCPSKYESGTDALTVERLMSYGSEVIGKTVRVTGTVVAGSQNAAGMGDRFMLADADDPSITIPVVFDGAVSAEALADAAQIVLTGDVTDDGRFSATDVALQG